MGKITSRWTAEKLREVLARDSNDARAWVLNRHGIETVLDPRELFEAAKKTHHTWGGSELPFGAASVLRAPIDPELLPLLEDEFEHSEGRSRGQAALAGVLAGARGELLEHVAEHTHDLFDLDRELSFFELSGREFSLTPEQQRELDAPHPVFEAAMLARARPEEITAERIARVGDQILPCIALRFGLLPAAPEDVLLTLAQLGELAGLSELRLEELWENPEDVVLDWGFLLMEAISQWPLPALATPAQMAWLEALEERLFDGRVEEHRDALAMQALYVRAWLCYKADAEAALARHEDDLIASARALYRYVLDTPEPLRDEPLEKLETLCSRLDAMVAMTALADELKQIWQDALRGDGEEVLFGCDFYDEISAGGLVASSVLPAHTHARFLAAVNLGAVMPMATEAEATFALMEEEANFREVCEEVAGSGDEHQREGFLFLLGLFAPDWAHEVLSGRIADWMRRTAWRESCHHIAALADERLFDELLALWMPGDVTLGVALRRFAAVAGREPDVAHIIAHDEAADHSPGRLEHHMCGVCGLSYSAHVTHCWVYEEDDAVEGLEFVPIPTCPHCDSVGSWEIEGYDQRKHVTSAFAYFENAEVDWRSDHGAFEAPAPGALNYLFAMRELPDVGRWERPLELVDDLRARIDASPTKPQYYFHLGRISSFLQNFGEATEILERGLKLQPQNLSGWYHLCRCYKALGDRTKAREAAWKLIERAHMHPDSEERAAFSAGAVEDILGGRPQTAVGLELVANTHALMRAGMIPLPPTARVRVRDVEWEVIYELLESGYLEKITRCPEPKNSEPTWAGLFRRFAQAGPWGGGGSQETFQHDGPKVGRNDPCPCGSGKKYKKCCMRK